MTQTVSLTLLSVTYRRVPLLHGVTAMATGETPDSGAKRIVALTDSAAVSITEIVPSFLFVTYARVPSGVIAMSDGERPTGMGVPTTAFVAVSITVIV